MLQPTPRHGEVCVNAAYLLRRFLDDQALGRVIGNDAAIITERGPDTVRGADIAFYSFQRVPPGPLPIGYLDVAPELVIEVRSPSERWATIYKKAAEYLDAGVVLVCVLDEPTRTATLYRGDQAVRTIAAEGELDLAEVLPGFRAPLRRFFD